MQLTASGHSLAREAAAALATLMDPHESACVASVNNAGHARSSALYRVTTRQAGCEGNEALSWRPFVVFYVRSLSLVVCFFASLRSLHFLDFLVHSARRYHNMHTISNGIT
jgi:hypothetical protein